uniref:Uncharacterized protein n=1 Tax=Heterorhabditis bacteriophora TaxID=37862 RepID=A0A1I7WR55_HETBA
MKGLLNAFSRHLSFSVVSDK